MMNFKSFCRKLKKFEYLAFLAKVSKSGELLKTAPYVNLFNNINKKPSFTKILLNLTS